MLQLTNPLAPQMARLALRWQVAVLRWRGIPAELALPPRQIERTSFDGAQGWGKDPFVGGTVTRLFDRPATLLVDGPEKDGYAPVTSTDLDALLRRVAHRDSDAFAALYDATRSRVYGMVLRVLRDRGYSEETTQDVYLQVWRTAESYDPASGSALAWLLTLAHRRAVDRVRSEEAASQRNSRYGAATIDRDTDDVTRGDCRRGKTAGRRLPRWAHRDAARRRRTRLLPGIDLRSGLRTSFGQPRDCEVADARCVARTAQVPGCAVRAGR